MQTFRPVVALTIIALISLTATDAHAVVVAGQDFDGGTNLLSETYTPDNTAVNGLFGASASRFDRFGIANVTVGDTLGDEGLPFDVVDASVQGFPGDVKGIVSEFKMDNFFVTVDVNNGTNLASPLTSIDGTATDVNARAVWTFDVSNHENLSLSIDMAMLGDFDIGDNFKFSYDIDGSALQTAFDLKVNTVDDGTGTGTLIDAGDTYAVSMDDGQVYQGATNSFFSAAEWGALGCTEIDLTSNPIVGPVAGSCAMEVPGDDADGFEYWRPHFDDTNQDGYVYFDSVTETLVDTPTNAGDLTEGAIRIYEDENSNGTFRTPEITGPNKDPLALDGSGTALKNQLADPASTYTTSLTGTGSVLTLTLEVTNDGSNEYFVFDNIVIEGTPTGGGLDCDLDGDGDCDLVDIEALVDEIVSGGPATAADISTWLSDASDPLNPYLGGAKTFVLGDANLDGSVGSDDLGLLLNKFGSTTDLDWMDGNMNGKTPSELDAVVDSVDLGLVLNNFGAVSAAAQAVPEPGTLPLLAMAFLGLVGVARRRK